MSKKNKRKFYNSPASGQPTTNSSSSGQQDDNSGRMSPVSNVSFSAPSGVSVASGGGTPSNAMAADVHAAEYKVIKYDLIKVVILNALFLAAVLTLYYTNLHSHYLENWFGKILHF